MVWIKIRVVAIVAVAGPPTSVDGKLRQVSEPVSDQVRIDSRRSAAHQSAKLIEICRSGSLGDEVRVEKGVVSDFIIGVVVDVHGHVLVKDFQGFSVGFISSPTRYFVILHASEFVVLDPKVSLEYFCRRCESKQSRIPRCQTPGRGGGVGRGRGAGPPRFRRPPRGNAMDAFANSPAPMVPAPTASDLPKKKRRLTALF